MSIRSDTQRNWAQSKIYWCLEIPSRTRTNQIGTFKNIYIRRKKKTQKRIKPFRSCDWEANIFIDIRYIIMYTKNTCSLDCLTPPTRRREKRNKTESFIIFRCSKMARYTNDLQSRTLWLRIVFRLFRSCHLLTHGSWFEFNFCSGTLYCYVK